ncbi:hypothetical protein D2V08_01045 [Flagellimonas lutimaris]|uniref:Outer membrane protein beta-barrel domain-containing protein n=1 Tax=Flagellimonas lutimaris TaxID=475082 RepID=A0A3A1NC47_9FLAO|nr:hypothetical protein [Allomuricauda lutimaris]RIV37702.1 hypothetical protein D2V08_01045 [Allomuricauda lutimaris]
MTLILILLSINGYSQLIDRYGINFGVTYTNQLWDYKLIPVDSDKELKFGFQVFIFAEKDYVFDIVALRYGIGFLQRGFKNQTAHIFSDGSEAEIKNNKVTLNEVVLNLGMKISPFKTLSSPYLLLGFRFGHMLSFRDIVIEEKASGLKYQIHGPQIENFNKFNFGSLITLGLQINRLLYIELEHNPNITIRENTEILRISDLYWGIKLGVNLKELIQH